MIERSNGWFSNENFQDFINALQTACSEHTRWLNQPECKYVEIRVDMRTGDFIVKNQQGHVLPLERIQCLLPELTNSERV